ncbi:hydroxyacid dehydrogenase, partial [Candidatus Parvarchaeota archaeon]|nr:hydroxyacid dehydrogenase [Candidatus Parvarchaeota archaeon]
HIDLEACARRGILVSNVPSYGESTVAEHTFALLLTISRKINRIYERTARADFSLSGMQGFDLEGKTIGVVGVGKIGSHVIRIARGFGMNVIAYEPHPKPQLASSLGFCYASFEELLALSDIITLHAPYNKSTYHLINSKNIGRLKKGVVLINTSRGELIETGALVRGLKKGLVGGAGLDVLEGEGLIKEEGQLLSKDYSQEALKTIIQNHVLLKFENVVITPHCAFYSHEAVRRIEDTTIENIKAFLRGGQANAVALGQ